MPARYITVTVQAQPCRYFVRAHVTRNEFGKAAEQRYLEAVQAFAGLPRGNMLVTLVDPMPLLTFSVNESTRQPGVEEFVLACADRNEVRETSAFLRGEASSVRNGDERPFQILQSTVLPDATDAAAAAQFLEDLATQLDLADAALPC